MPYRSTLGLCLVVLASNAVAQENLDTTVLRGVLTRDAEAAGGLATSRAASTDPAGNTRNASKTSGLSDGLVPATADVVGQQAASTPQGRVRSVEPLTTGSIGSAAIEDEGAFGGDTTRDAPRGIRVGGYLVFPELTLRGGATDNASGVPGGEAGSFYRVSPSVRLRSDWERHQYEASLRGSYQGYPDDPGDDQPSVEFTSSLRIDAGDETTLQGDLAYGLSSEGRSSAESAGGSGDRILSHGLGGSLSALREVGVIAARLRGSVDGTAYSGDNLSGDNRNNILTSAGLRLGYGIHATISPFAEATVLGRLYEDAPGRDALGYELRGGLKIDRGEKLSGEVAVGWHSEDLEGQAYKSLEGILVEAEMAWSPTRLTTVTVSASTAFEASSLSGASGSVVYGSDLTMAHSLSDNLAVEVGGSASYRQYQGLDLDELMLSGTTGATYAISSTAALQARYTYEWFDSSTRGRDYSSNTIEAGVRLRR